VIVGIDPGTTVGLAVLDLRGNLLHLSSKRGADDSWIFETIRRYGTPIIIATDKSSVPSRVQKIAAQFGARVWSPKEDISVQTKEEIARRFSYRYSGPEDDHQRDALAAAFLAYQSYAPKFRQVEKRVGSNREKEEFVKRAVVFGQSMDRAAREFDERDKAVVAEKPRAVHRQRHDVSELLKIIAELRAELREKEQIVRELRKRVSELEAEVERLRKRKRIVFKDEEMEKMRMQRDEAKRRASQYQKRLRKLEEILERIAKGEYRVVPRQNGKDAVYVTESAAVVPQTEEEREEDLAEKIAKLIEEYRAGRK